MSFAAIYGMQLRHGGRACFGSIGTTRSEGASGRQIRRVGHQTFDRLQHFALFLQVRQAVEQALGVGMAHVVEYILNSALLHNTAGIHNCHIVADLGNDTQTVRNHQHGHITVVDEVLH